MPLKSLLIFGDTGKGTRIPVDWEFTPGVGYFLSLQNERFDIAVYVRMEPE